MTNKFLLFLIMLVPFLAKSQTVVDIVVNSPDHNTLEQAVIDAGLVGALSGDGPFTLFAPTDDAFANVDPVVLQALLDDPTGALAEVLQYHVVTDSVPAENLADGDIITTLQGSDVLVSIDGVTVMINEAMVTVTNIPATNGIVHVIDAVLIPSVTTVFDVISGSPIHNTLETAIVASGLDGTLSGEGSFTIFAPTDDAFDLLGSELLDELLMDPMGALQSILLYHALDSEVKEEDLVDGAEVATINGKSVTISVDMMGAAMVNQANITITDLETDNGVVHVIDAVLIPPTITITDIVNGSDVHNTLETALDVSGLDDILSGEGSFTLFAPTDAAFDLLDPVVLQSLLDDPNGALTDVLLYHALDSEVLAEDLSDGDIVTTINGKDATITVNADGAFINDALISITNLEADNGVVHVIDAVLIPPTITVVDIAVGNPAFSTLVTAVTEAGLVETLQGEGPFTVFAPTNDAFDALPEGVLESLLDDPSGALTDILLYHVISDNLVSTGLMDGQKILTINGSPVKIRMANGKIFINEAEIIATDFIADNGVVHAIDAVITPLPETVVDIIVASEAHDTLEAAVIAAELDGVLSGEGPFTVFAPTDDAFKNLPEGTIEALLMDPTGDLADILLYHVLDSEVYGDELVDGQIVTTVLGKDIVVTLNSDGAFINDAKVTVTDIIAENGVVHVLDAVLSPPSVTIVDVVVNSDINNTLETAVVAAGLVETLSGEGPFTLFAPTDDAFNALEPGVLQALLDDPAGALTDVLTYHVLGQEVPSTALNNGDVVATVNGKDITVTINADGVFINDAEVTMTDIPADNGIVHVIDAVLIPPTTIVDVVVNSDIHTTLETAVIAAGLVETLSGEGPFTLFAPTDEAFDALEPGVLQALLDDPTGALTDVLTYHVLGQEVPSTALNDGDIVTTVNGKDVTVTINADGVFINDAEVTLTDIPASNGIVHVIDAVLIPPTNTVFDIIANSAVHNTLEDLIIDAELQETLSGEGTFTVFAPTDEAFTNAPTEIIAELLADPTGKLQSVLLHHVVGSIALEADLSDGQAITTEFNQDVTITIEGGNVFVDDAQVIITDLEGDNGVVHVINGVLLPTGVLNTEFIEMGDLNIYPNPAQDFILVDLGEDFDRSHSIQLLNQLGQTVKMQEVQGQYQMIDMNDLATGNYFLRIVSANNSSVPVKISKI